MKRKFPALLLAAVLVIVMGGSALASGVTYVNRTELFDFKPGSMYHVTDLFENFKNVMPGDVLEQKIIVQNSSEERVRIWLQCKYDAWTMTEAGDFLDKLKLTVISGNNKIFEAAAGEKAQLTKPKLLGTFKEGGKVELTVRLEVPIELGNEYMGQIGIVPWTFSVEEVPDDDTPDTGDWFEIGIWAGTAVLLTLAIVILLIIQRKKRVEAK